MKTRRTSTRKNPRLPTPEKEMTVRFSVAVSGENLLEATIQAKEPLFPLMMSFVQGYLSTRTTGVGPPATSEPSATEH